MKHVLKLLFMLMLMTCTLWQENEVERMLGWKSEHLDSCPYVETVSVWHGSENGMFSNVVFSTAKSEVYICWSLMEFCLWFSTVWTYFQFASNNQGQDLQLGMFLTGRHSFWLSTFLLHYLPHTYCIKFC